MLHNQFIEPKFRQNVIDKIYKSLNWGGAFVLKKIELQILDFKIFLPNYIWISN